MSTAPLSRACTQARISVNSPSTPTPMTHLLPPKSGSTAWDRPINRPSAPIYCFGGRLSFELRRRLNPAQLHSQLQLLFSSQDLSPSTESGRNAGLRPRCVHTPLGIGINFSKHVYPRQKPAFREFAAICSIWTVRITRFRVVQTSARSLSTLLWRKTHHSSLISASRINIEPNSVSLQTTNFVRACGRMISSKPTPDGAVYLPRWGRRSHLQSIAMN